jgi:hypothetical protein
MHLTVFALWLVSAVTLSLRPRADKRNFMRAAGQMMTAASVAGLILIGYWPV